MIRQTLAAATLLLLAANAAPAQDQETAADYDADTVVARVGDTEITLGELLAARMRLPEQYQSAPPDILYEAIRDQLVNQQVLADSLEGPPPPSIALMMKNEERALLANRALEQYLAQDLPDAEVQAAYDEAFGDFQPVTEYNASHILLESEEAAVAVKAELDAGADFAATAQERSVGPSAPQGGELGWFGPGMMVPEFEAAVAALEVGQVSAPFQTQFGWHVAKLNDRRETAAPTLEEVRPQLVEELRDRSLAAEIEARREAADVELLDEEIPVEAIGRTDLLDP